MKNTRILMGMPITVEVVDPQVVQKDIDDIYDYFDAIDKRFSTYKSTSEISKINRGELDSQSYSQQMKEVFLLAQQTKKETYGYFDIKNQLGEIDPSGLVKGWSIYNAAEKLKEKGFTNFYIDAGGDIQASGTNAQRQTWKVGIKNPFNDQQIIKVLFIQNEGVATSGTYIRGQHIYNPHQPSRRIQKIVSLTVIGPNIYDADRFATAAFAMEDKGIAFIEQLNGFEGYCVNKDGVATYTSGFNKYTQER